MEQVYILGADRPIVHQSIEVNDLIPEFLTVQDNWDVFLHSACLHKGQDFEQFVQRAEAAGKQHRRFRQISKPELAHEEVVKVDVEFPTDIRIVELFVWQ